MQTSATMTGKPNVVLPVTGLLVLLAFFGIAVLDRGLYERLIDLWSFHVGSEPFIDLSAPLAWIECWRQGVDVFVATPCDLLNRPICYSPLLLRLPLPWVDRASTPFYALVMECGYMASLAVLPRARRRIDTVALLLLLFSPLCVFGLERANLDLLIFVMVAIGIVCLERCVAWRLAGYSLFLAAGLLKFYPWALLTMLLRERPALFALLASAAAAVIAGFVGLYHDELSRMLVNMPLPVFADDAFGAMQTPAGLAIITHALHAPPGDVDSIDLTVWAVSAAVLFTLALAGALRLGRRAEMQRAFAQLDGREALCLSVGAVLLCGSFFAGINVGYRAVFLLFALPGMLALARVTHDARFARHARLAVAAALLVVWSLPVQRLIIAAFGRFWRPEEIVAHRFGTPLPGIAYWLLREALWWWLMTFLLAIVLRTVLDSRSWRDTLSMLSWARA